MELDAEVGFTLGSDQDMPDALGGTPDARKWVGSRFRRLSSGSQTSVGSGAAVTILDLQAPERGRAWELMSLAVIGSDSVTQIAGSSVAIYVTSSPQAPLPLSDCIRPAVVAGTTQTVPFHIFPQRGSVIIQPSEHLLAVVFTASITQSFIATASVYDQDIDSTHEWMMSGLGENDVSVLR